MSHTPDTELSGRHPVNIGHLVMGLAFVGLVGVWALIQGDVVQGEDIRWLLPVPWVVAGIAGLLASTLSGRSRRAERQTGWVGPTDPYATGDRTPRARTPTHRRPVRRRLDHRQPLPQHRPHRGDPMSIPQPAPRPQQPKRLVRRSDDRMVAGVCSGVADYFGVDVTLVRLVTVVGAIFGFGSLILAYVVAWALLPEE